MSNCNRSSNNYRNQRTGSPQNFRSREASCEQDKELWRMPLAMAYVPWQQFTALYNEEEALCKGTIFSELNLVFTGRGCCN